MLTIADLAESRQLEHRGFWHEFERADGRRVTYPGPPLNIFVDGEPFGDNRRPPPELGEHNAEVFAELGLSVADCERLQSEGVI